MAKIKIDRDRCKGCELCIIHCPRGCIQKSETLNLRGVYPAVFEEKKDKCTGCSFCVIVCPDCCITIDK